MVHACYSRVTRDLLASTLQVSVYERNLLHVISYLLALISFAFERGA